MDVSNLVRPGRVGGREVNRPSVHMLLLGGLLWLGVQVSDTWTTRALRETSEDPVARPLVDPQDELFFRLGLERGWERSDPVVRQWLARDLRFASVGARPESEGALADEALALGLDRSDGVVRRRLAQRVRLELRAAARSLEPDEAVLEGFLREHGERFALPDRVSFEQVFLGRTDGARTEHTLSALRGGADPASLGVPSLLPRRFELRDRRALALRVGPELADTVFGLETGEWSGPHASTFGVHLVRVRERHPAHVPDVARIRGRVREAWFEARENELVNELVDRLRERGDRGSL